MPSLAERIATDGYVDAAAIGRAAVELRRAPLDGPTVAATLPCSRS
jgi:hypothetical protein